MGASSIRQLRNGLTLVGMYLLRWGQLETALSTGFTELCPEETGPEIDPDSISRTLTHLLSKWKRACKEQAQEHRKAIDTLCDKITTAVVHRNTICHGFQSIFTTDDPNFYTIACYHQFHRNRMTGQLPEQHSFEHHYVIALIKEVEGFTQQVKQFSDAALERRGTNPTPTGK